MHQSLLKIAPEGYRQTTNSDEKASEKQEWPL